MATKEEIFHSLKKKTNLAEEDCNFLSPGLYLSSFSHGFLNSEMTLTQEVCDLFFFCHFICLIEG